MGSVLRWMHIKYALVVVIICITYMRTTLDLPEDLLSEAIRLSPHRTKTAVITAALEDFIRRRRLQALRRYKGKVKLDVDLDTLRKRA